MKQGIALVGLVVAIAGCKSGEGVEDPTAEGNCRAPLCASAAQEQLCCRDASSIWVGYDECQFEGFDVEDECGTVDATACLSEETFRPPTVEGCAPACEDSRCRAALLAEYCCGEGFWFQGICETLDDSSRDVCPEGCSGSRLTRDCCVSESTHCGPRPPVVITEP